MPLFISINVLYLSKVSIDWLEVNMSYKIHDIYKKIYIISIPVYNSYKLYYKLSAWLCDYKGNVVMVTPLWPFCQKVNDCVAIC